MAQNINLYDPALRRQRVWLTLGNVALAAGIFAAVLVAAGAVVRSRADSVRAEVVGVENDIRRVSAELVAATQALDAGASKQMQADAARLQAQLSARREVLAALHDGAGRNESTAGFGEYLRGRF